MAKASRKPAPPAVSPATGPVPVTIAGVETLAPGIVGGSGPKIAKRKFRFKVTNDFAGTFDGTLEGESEQAVRDYLIAGLTRGLEVREVI